MVYTVGMSNDFVKTQYNKIAENYLAGRDQFKNTKYLEILHGLLPPQSKILDVGCGGGVPIDKFFLDKGHEVIGIDISEAQIALAKKHVPSGTFIVEDMSEFVDGEYTVDAVVSFYAIFHTKRETHKDIVRKLHTFLAPGGMLLITMGATDWEGKEDDFFGGQMEWSHYGKDTNIKLIEDAGFEILLSEIDTTGGEQHVVILAKKR